jgi:hypothetical protein
MRRGIFFFFCIVHFSSYLNTAFVNQQVAETRRSPQRGVVASVIQSGMQHEEKANDRAATSLTTSAQGPAATRARWRFITEPRPNAIVRVDRWRHGVARAATYPGRWSTYWLSLHVDLSVYAYRSNQAESCFWFQLNILYKIYVWISPYLYVTTMQETTNCGLHPQPSQQRPSTIGAVAGGARSRFRVGEQGHVRILNNEQIRKEASTYVSRTCKQANFA